MPCRSCPQILARAEAKIAVLEVEQGVEHTWLRAALRALIDSVTTELKRQGRL